MEFNTDDLPPFIQLLQHQIAGRHVKNKISILKHEDGNILKLWRPDGRGDKEASFYKLVFESQTHDPILNELKMFVPIYRGIFTINFNGASTKFLKLEDIADEFKKPSNLDVKIGSIPCHPTEAAEKRKLQLEKYPQGAVIGFRISGMRVYCSDIEEFAVIGKEFGLSLSLETITDGLYAYFNRDNTCLTLFIISGFLHRLKCIENWFKKQKRFLFYRTSLLFFYESDAFSWLSLLQTWLDCYPFNKPISYENKHELLVSLKDSSPSNFENSNSFKKFLNNIFIKSIGYFLNENVCPICFLNVGVCEKLKSTPLMSIHMIDFAHYYSTETVDENYLFGLSNLIKHYQKLQQDILNRYLNKD